MNNPNNIITVHFPNGQSRRRNAQTTVIPEDRVYPKPIYPAHADVYSRVDYATLKNNELREKIDQQRFDNGNNWPFLVLLVALGLAVGLAVGLLIYFLLS